MASCWICLRIKLLAFQEFSTSQVNKRKGEEYQLLWSEEPDFVRMAAKLDALIVPFASVGGDEAFDIALDSDEILRTPILGDLMRRVVQRVDPSLDISESVPPLTKLPGIGLPSLLPIPNLSRLYFRWISQLLSPVLLLC